MGIYREGSENTVLRPQRSWKTSDNTVLCPQRRKANDSAVLCPQRLREALHSVSEKNSLGRADIPVVLCIGTDRIIGDCLGPLVGTMLCRDAGEALSVYGTLQNTVHALNLPEAIAQIKKKHPRRMILAVDASLGSMNQVGSVFVRPGCLRPGAGVSKNLPEIGDVSITGICNSESSRPYLDLQTARLSTVSAMADRICACILEVCLP